MSANKMSVILSHPSDVILKLNHGNWTSFLLGQNISVDVFQLEESWFEIKNVSDQTRKASICHDLTSSWLTKLANAHRVMTEIIYGNIIPHNVSSFTHIFNIFGDHIKADQSLSFKDSCLF